ncbi:MAG TPA: phage tail sheath subtilisin-like domain-containing protein [Longimicrobium sp.]|nr:phage tail sheath subtilisin-like domain-containing protein [Longimicrobium sp.]
MPSALSYPGVYIEELPSGVRTITGVSTSVTAFVGQTAKGPVDRAVRVFNFGDYDRAFGGLHRDSDVSYAVQQFFMNGGSDAYVVRVALNAQPASATLKDAQATPATVLTLTAAEPGLWGNDLRVKVDHATADPANLFNLFVARVDPLTLSELEPEEFRNLSMDDKSPAYVESVVNAGSRLVRAARAAGLPFGDKGFSVSGDLTAKTLAGPDPLHLTFLLNGETKTLTLPAPAAPATGAAAIEPLIDAAITASPLNGAIVASQSNATGGSGTTHLKLESAATDDSSAVVVIPGPGNDISALLGFGPANGGLEKAGAAKHRPAVAGSVALQGGSDGSAPGATEYQGKEADKTGMYALLDVDLFNLLCIPGTARLADTEAKAVLGEAIALCQQERAFLIIDPPPEKDHKTVVAWAEQLPASRNAAVYYPRILAADPLRQFRLREMPASGALAGIYARTDAERGVWKAPAGTEAVLRGTQGLSYLLTDAENGVLNQKGVNALRSFPVYGRVAWGARTRKGADAQGDEYKYIPVRRLALYLEETLFRSTQWVVFEPNDEPLWSQIRLNVGSFMHGLFRQGAFQGNTPAKAYQVKCDAETTTQYDIDRGVVNILVAFAPLKPAEFVVIQIQQKAQVPS